MNHTADSMNVFTYLASYNFDTTDFQLELKIINKLELRNNNCENVGNFPLTIV